MRDGIGMTASLDLAGGSIADTFGNILTDRTFSAPSNLSSVAVDGRITSITGVTVDSGHYKQGEHIDIEVTFNKAITVTGSPKIGIDVGGNAKFAVYNSIAANTLTFRYRVEANLNDADGIGMTTSINVSEGTITDSGSNAVSGSSLDFTEPANLALVKVDNTAPTIDSVTTVAAGTYLLGQHLDVTVNFNEDIVVDSSSGTPKIVLTVGSNDRDALYNETESTARALVFRYTVVDGDEDNSGGIGIASSIELEGGTIKDLAEHNAPTTITAPDSSQVLVDAAAPTITSVTTVAAGGYSEGSHLDVTVNFSEAVTIGTDDGTPKIVLTVGDNDRDALYNASESTNTVVVFRYTVVAEESSNGVRNCYTFSY